MVIKFNKNAQLLEYNGKVIRAWCNVRTLANGLRKKDEVVYSIPSKHPYDPAEFPVGTWQVFAPVARNTLYLAPYFIPTSARQRLAVWEIKDGEYFRPTAVDTLDDGYGLHYSTSPTTLGCIRIAEKKDLLDLVKAIQDEKAQCFIEVTE